MPPLEPEVPLPVLPLEEEPVPLEDEAGGQLAEVLPGGQSAEVEPLAELPVEALPEVPGVLLGVEGVAPAPVAEPPLVALPVAELPVPALPELLGVLLDVDGVVPVLPVPALPLVPDCVHDTAASANSAALVAETRSLTLMRVRSSAVD